MLQQEWNTYSTRYSTRGPNHQCRWWLVAIPLLSWFWICRVHVRQCWTFTAQDQQTLQTVGCYVSGPLSLYSLSTKKGGDRTQHLTQTLLQVSNHTWSFLQLQYIGDTPVGFQSKYPMESVTVNCADRFLVVFSFGQMMSNEMCW